MKMYNVIKTGLIGLIIWAAIPGMILASDLFIDPASPIVEVGGQITLLVTNAVGDVKWTSFEGEIEKTGNPVIYLAPDQSAIDGVTAKDSAGNIGTISVIIMEKQDIQEHFEKINANWEIFTDRSWINALIFSDDNTTLWVGTDGGLEKRSAVNGEVRQVYTNQSGLPDNNVRSLLSDGQGGIWVGTYGGGLAHLEADGTWEYFDTSGSDLPDNYVYTIVSDGQGGIWVGMFDSKYKGGIAHLKADGLWEHFDTSNSGLPYNMINALLSDGQGGVWAGTMREGLAHLKSDGTWELFDAYNSCLWNNDVESLLSDGQGGIWVGTRYGGLSHLKADGMWEEFDSYCYCLPDNWIYSLLSDAQGGIWVGTMGDGLVHMKADGTKEIFDTSNSGLPHNEVQVLLSDGRGGIWVGTRYGGLAYMKADGVWYLPDTPDAGLPDKYVNSLLSDSQGGIWVGTQNSGVAHLKSDGTWQIFNPSNSDLPDKSVSTLLSDGQGGIWVGIWDKGIAHMKSDGIWEILDISNSGLPDNNVGSLVSDGHGGVWMGTLYDGLAHLKSDGTWEILDILNSGLPDNHITYLLYDGQGGIWVGTESSGLAHLKSDNTWEVFATYPDNHVRSLLIDDQGGIWVGTDKGGLTHLNSGSTWDASYIARNNPVYSLLSDTQGGIWVGTKFGGLAHLKSDETWERLDTSNSDLPGNFIDCLLSDGRGGIWVGTQGHGLAHITYVSGTINNEQYLTGGRAAIIIAGGGNTDDNALWDSTAKISNYIYKMLNRRGFLNTDIYYISPQPFADFNGDGMDDKIVDAPTPARQIQVSDIQAAFDWAKNKGDLNQPLYIFFTDHGGIDRLQLAKGVYIEASELKIMLDDYQKSTGNKVILVIDACHSGTMVKALAGENRGIISSTDAGLAYFDRTEDQSFNYFVTKGLFKGMNFVEAFHDAVSKQKKLLGKLSDYSMVSAGEAGDYTQEPQYDDTGDGLYTISVDGNWLKQVSINGNVTMADITLNVMSVTQPGAIPASTVKTPTLLKARATLAAGIVKRVWAVIRPPQMDILVDNTGIPLLAFPKTDLSASNTEGEENLYQGSWDRFVYNGEYEITFYAEDNEGNIESSESIKLTVADGMECPLKGSLKVHSGKSVYKAGDTLNISVTENLAYGYDLYIILLMPDGNATALKQPLKNSDGLQQQDFNSLYWGDRWMDMHRTMGRAINVMEMTLPQENLPHGQYCLYAVLIPQGQYLFNAVAKGLFVLDGICFEVSGGK